MVSLNVWTDRSMGVRKKYSRNKVKKREKCCKLDKSKKEAKFYLVLEFQKQIMKQFTKKYWKFQGGYLSCLSPYTRLYWFWSRFKIFLNHFTTIIGLFCFNFLFNFWIIGTIAHQFKYFYFHRSEYFIITTINRKCYTTVCWQLKHQFYVFRILSKCIVVLLKYTDKTSDMYLMITSVRASYHTIFSRLYPFPVRLNEGVFIKR